MKDCELFKKHLLDSMPPSVRHSIEHTVNAMDASHTVLRLMGNAVKCAVPPCNGLDPMVIAIGSFGRLDGQPHLSDVDAIYLYEGKTQKAKSLEVQKFIGRLVLQNKCLLFDHRDEIEKNKFDFAKSPAYPVMGSGDMTTKNSLIRAIQVLTKGRALYGVERVEQLRSRLLADFGYRCVPANLDLEPFLSGLRQFRDSYCTALLGRKKNSGWKLTNRKVLKLFALREFAYLANLFASAEVYLCVALSITDRRPPLMVFSAPSILKIASWCSPHGVFAEVLQRYGGATQTQAITILKRGLKAMSQTEQELAMAQINDTTDAELFRYLRAYIIRVLEKHDTLIQLLHSPEFLDSFDQFEPDIGTWIAKPSFTRILNKRNAMVDALRLLAKQLGLVLPMLEAQGVVTHGAEKALAEIASYNIMLTPGAA